MAKAPILTPQATDFPRWYQDIVAKAEGDVAPAAPGGPPGPMQLMMQALLAERFKLVVHRDTRELQTYALVLAIILFADRRPDSTSANRYSHVIDLTGTPAADQAWRNTASVDFDRT